VLPAVLSGMVGSSIGWQEVPYLKCPARPRPSRIRPCGLKRWPRHRHPAGPFLRGKSGAPDVMRGEETQILGALHLHPNLTKGRHLLLLPGTHTKWVLVADGAVTQFQTALSGELFELLRRHSVLARDSAKWIGKVRPLRWDWNSRVQEADLLHLLFSARSRVVTGEMSKRMPRPICRAWYWARTLQAPGAVRADGPVQLICTPAAGALYGKALAAYDVKSATIDGDRAAWPALSMPIRKSFHDGSACRTSLVAILRGVTPGRESRRGGGAVSTRHSAPSKCR
jgi:2-dehydro-3-deoxygalactonokinase